jgi:hypothetical protein
MDRTTKTLLAAIALGLWATLAAQFWVVQAQGPDLRRIERLLTDIHAGVCLNPKLC